MKHCLENMAFLGPLHGFLLLLLLLLVLLLVVVVMVVVVAVGQLKHGAHA